MISGDSQQGARMGCNPRLLIGLVIVVVTLMSYYSKSQVNPVTGEKQHISMSKDQEITLGLQAAPEMAQQHGGAVEHGPDADIVRRVGERIVARTKARGSGDRYQFHLLADPQTINAFALPGGQVFITRALLGRLESEGQLAGVLGHEIGHVVGRHGAEHMSKTQLIQGLTGAAVMATYDPSNPSSQQQAAMAEMVGGLINMKYGREDESEADSFGLQYMVEAGYDPRGMIGVMNILEQASQGNRQPEFMSTHPNPGNRRENIKRQISEMFPDGVPEGLTP